MLNRTLRYASLALALLLFSALAGCALPSPVPVEDGEVAASPVDNSTNANAPSDTGSYLVNVTDMAGNAVQLGEAVSRIVVLDPADCEILYALGAGDLIVGRNADCDYPAEANLIPYVTVNGAADAELILLREPQVVILSAESAQDAELLKALSGAGIVPVVTNALDVNGIYSAISLLGAVTNRVSEANALVSGMITSLAELQSKLSQHEETVYLELSPLGSGLATAGGNTFASSLIALIGFHNEFEDQAGMLSITQDQVIGRSPDYILTTTETAPSNTAAETPVPGETTAPESTAPPEGEAAAAAATGVDEILSRTDWQSIDAVSGRRVYYIDARLLTRAGPRLLDAANALYTIFYEGKQP